MDFPIFFDRSFQIFIDDRKRALVKRKFNYKAYTLAHYTGLGLGQNAWLGEF